MFDFKDTKRPESNKFLKPGYYRVTVKEAEFIEPEGTKQDGVTPKTPYIMVTFGSDDGTVREKYYVTPKAMNRLQYLHEELVGKPIDKAFNDSKQVGTYFLRVLNHDSLKKKERFVVVSGKIVGDNVYGELGFSDYFLPDDAKIELGEFQRNSIQYNKYTKTEVNESTVTSDMIINSSPTNIVGSDMDDLPF